MHTLRFQLDQGDRNVGTIHLPDDLSKPLPVLVVCIPGPGNAEPTAFTQSLRRRGTAAGMAVVTFDLHGWGDTGGDPNEGSYGRWAANLADVCTYISSHQWADAHRVGALGVSAGSTAVLRCAIETRKLAFGISVATYIGHFTLPVGPAKMLVDNLDTLASGRKIEVKGSSGATIYHVGLDYFLDAIGGAPVYRLHELTCPIFFLQGGADNAFRRSDARLGYDLLRSDGLPAKYLEIERGDHVLANVAAEATTAVLEWLREVEFLR